MAISEMMRLSYCFPAENVETTVPYFNILNEIPLKSVKSVIEFSENCNG